MKNLLLYLSYLVTFFFCGCALFHFAFFVEAYVNNGSTAGWLIASIILFIVTIFCGDISDKLERM